LIVDNSFLSIAFPTVWLIGVRAFFVVAEKTVFRDQKKGHEKQTFFFISLWRAHARKEEGKLCGEVVKT
jgi:hypothetical protein